MQPIFFFHANYQSSVILTVRLWQPTFLFCLSLYQKHKEISFLTAEAVIQTIYQITAEKMQHK